MTKRIGITLLPFRTRRKMMSFNFNLSNKRPSIPRVPRSIYTFLPINSSHKASCLISPSLSFVVLEINSEKVTMMTMKLASEPSPRPAGSRPECCMCGDCGLSYELIRCSVCQFRYQHRYCSNLYPKADLYKVCNWCLSNIDEENNRDKSNNSSNSSSSIKANSEEESKGTTNHHLRRKINGGILRRSSSGGSLKLQLKVNQNRNNIIPIKKQVTNNNNNNSSSPERSPTTTRKRIITRAKLEEMKLRRTRSEDISRINYNNNSNSGPIHKHVFRNKVRRYKLLDEVSS